GHLLTAVKSGGQVAFDRSWNRGQALSVGEAMALGLEIVVPIFASTTSLPAPFPAGNRASHPAAPTHTLTGREMEVLRLLRSGKADLDISGELFIGVRTVQTHVSRILAKLGVNSRSEAVARAIRDGVI
ncbi:MAG: response regulator transcription factor, partial [Thermomicrobiales bacterium]